MSLKKAVTILALVILISGLAAGLGVVLKMYYDSEKQLRLVKTQIALGLTPEAEGDKNVADKVGKHILLPDEEPKIITIDNADELRASQPFFEKAENGDKVLVYSQKVILYNPNIDKIIEIAQIKADTPPEIQLPLTATESGEIISY